MLSISESRYSSNPKITAWEGLLTTRKLNLQAQGQESLSSNPSMATPKCTMLGELLNFSRASVFSPGNRGGWGVHDDGDIFYRVATRTK